MFGPSPSEPPTNGPEQAPSTRKPRRSHTSYGPTRQVWAVVLVLVILLGLTVMSVGVSAKVTRNWSGSAWGARKTWSTTAAKLQGGTQSQYRESQLLSVPAKAPAVPAPEVWNVDGTSTGLTFDFYSRPEVQWTDAGLFVISQGRMVRLDPRDGTKMWLLDLVDVVGGVARPAVTHAGRQWVIVGDVNTGAAIDAETGKVLWRHNGAILSGSPDRVLLFRSSPEYSGVVREVRSGKDLGNLDRASELKAAISADGRTVATGSDDVKVHDAETGKVLWKGLMATAAVAFHPKGLVAADRSSVILASKEKELWRTPISSIEQLKVLSNGNVAVANAEGLTILSGGDGKVLGQFKGRPTFSNDPNADTSLDGWQVVVHGDKMAALRKEDEGFLVGDLSSFEPRKIPLDPLKSVRAGHLMFGQPSRDSGKYTPVAYDLFTGQQVWQAPVGSLASPVGAVDGMVITLARSHSGTSPDIGGWGVVPAQPQPPSPPGLSPVPSAATQVAGGNEPRQHRQAPASQPMVLRYSDLLTSAPTPVPGKPTLKWKVTQFHYSSPGQICSEEIEQTDAGLIVHCKARVHKIDQATGKPIWTFDGSSIDADGFVKLVAAGPDWLIVEYIASRIRVAIDAATGQELWRHHGEVRGGSPNRVMLFGKDGKGLVVREAKTGADILQLPEALVYTAALRPDGAQVAYSELSKVSQSSKTEVVDLASKQPVLTFDKAGKSAFHPRGLLVNTLSASNSTVVYLLGPQGPVWELDQAVNEVRAGPGSEVLAFNEHSITVLDGETGKKKHAVRAAGQPVHPRNGPKVERWPLHMDDARAYTLTGDGGGIQVVDLASGQSKPTPLRAGLVAMAGDHIYSSEDDSGMAVSLKDGTTVWQVSWGEYDGLIGHGAGLVFTRGDSGEITAWG